MERCSSTPSHMLLPSAAEGATFLLSRKYNPEINYVVCSYLHMYKIITKRPSPGELRVMTGGAGFFCRTSADPPAVMITKLCVM